MEFGGFFVGLWESHLGLEGSGVGLGCPTWSEDGPTGAWGVWHGAEGDPALFGGIPHGAGGVQ